MLKKNVKTIKNKEQKEKGKKIKRNPFSAP